MGKHQTHSHRKIPLTLLLMIQLFLTSLKNEDIKLYVQVDQEKIY